MVTLEFKIKKHLESLLKGNFSLTEFEDWFVGTTWDLLEQPENDLTAFVNSINLYLAEYSNGHRSEEETKELLGALYDKSLTKIVFGSCSPTYPYTFTLSPLPLPSFGIVYEAVSS